MPRRFRGPLVTEGVQTGDGRVIEPGAVTWPELPLPFGFIVGGDQHVNAVMQAPQVGIIESISRAENGDLIGEGQIDDGQPDGVELVRRMDAGLASHGSRQLVSIDPDDWAVDLLWMGEDSEEELLLAHAGRGQVPQRVTAAAGDPSPEGGELMFSDASDMLIERYTRMRIRGATACAVSAFTSAWIELVDDEPAEEEEAPAPEARTAAAAPARTTTLTRPPAAAFHLPEPEPGAEDDGSVYGMPVQELLVEQPDGGLAVPFTVVERDGVRWCFGHAARWGQCHVGYPGQCVTAPESVSGYAHFHHGSVECDDGSTLATGPLTMATDHADADLLAAEARDHYAHTGLGFADVRASNGALGVWTAGVIRPGVTDLQLQVIRASSLSGDWRRIGAGLEFIGALAVNIPGFPIARELVASSGVHLAMASLAASAFSLDGVQQSLVAAGIVQRCPECQRRAMAGRGLIRAFGAALMESQPSPEQVEMLALIRKVELRTRHLTPLAAEHALDGLRR